MAFALKKKACDEVQFLDAGVLGLSVFPGLFRLMDRYVFRTCVASFSFCSNRQGQRVNRLDRFPVQACAVKPSI